MLSSTPTVPNSGHFAGKLADMESVGVNGDYEVDHSALSEFHLQKCADANVFVQILLLSTPVKICLALGAREGDPEVFYEAKKEARISITIQLTVGPLRLRNVELLVFEEAIDDLLLSRPLLNSLSFELDKHLSCVRNTVHDTDFSHIGFNASSGSTSDTSLPSHPFVLRACY